MPWGSCERNTMPPCLLSGRRDDVAELAVASLMAPEAAGLTFEVKSDLAFSTKWTGAEETQSPRNYG